MAVLTNKSIASTYTSLLSIGSTSTSSLGSSIQSLTDGTGQLSPLAMSTTQIQFNTSTNTFLFPSTRGTINQILRLSDANGTLAWGNESNSNQLDTAGNSGTGSITLDSQSLTLTGTTNEITTNANAQSISIGFPTAGVTLPNNSIATTQLATDTSTKIATTKYVTDAIGDIVIPTGDVTKTGTITANQIAVWNDSTDELRSDETVTIGTDHSITLLQKNSLDDDRATYNIGGGNIDDVTGQNNVGFGKDNLGYLVSGQDNNAFGNNSQISNSSGSYNTSFGNQTLNYHSSSDYNVAIGYQSLRGDNIGGTPSSDNNTAIGTFSLRLVDGGNSNTALGYNSGSAITTGSNNVIIGSFTGFRAAVVGGLAEYSIITSNNNIVISDGVGNVRQSFDSNGDATFNGDVKVSELNPLIFADSTSSNKASGIITSESGTSKWAIGTNFGSGDNSFNIYNYTAASRYLTISSGGNVKIGDSTTDITSKLTVSGNGSVNTATFMYDGNAGTYFDIDTEAANGSVILSADARSGNYPPMLFKTGGSTQLTISSGGNVGIGNSVTDPVKTLDVRGQLAISNSASSYWYMDRNGDGNFQIIDDANNPAITIDTSRNVGIGTDSPSAVLEVYAGSDSTANTILWGETIRNAANASTVGYGVGLKLKISSDSGNEANKWAGIAAVAGTSYANTTDLAFYTNAVSGNIPTEKVRIDALGDTTITTINNQGGLTITSATDNTTLRLINTSTGANSGQDWRLYSTGGSSGLGAGKLFIKVSDTETVGRLLSFVDGGSDIKMGIGTKSPVQPLQLGDVSVITQDVNSMYVGVNFGGSTNGTYIKSQYANQIHFDSAAGQIKFRMAGSGTEGNNISYTTAMRIASGGEVGIGGEPLGGNGLRILTNAGATMADFRNTLSSGYGLYVAGATGTKYSFRVADYNNSPRFTVFGNGSATLLGYLTEGGSDIRFKKNIEKIPNAIEKIKSINGYTFEWDKNNEYNFSLKEGKDVGVIAQEIEKVLPEVVSIAPIDREDDGKSKSGKNYLTVDYKKIVPLLIQGIKEQQTIIEDLKARIETLEG